MNKALRSLPSWLAGLISVVVVLLVWEAVCRFGQVREVILPRPTLILKDLYGELGWYLSQALYTLGVTLAGFALAAVGGVLIAVALVSSPLFERFCYPLIVGFNSIPKVALAPLFVVWMGTGYEPKVAIAFMIAVFAVIVDTVQGLRSVSPDILDLGRVLKGGPVAMFFKVRLPSALPSIMAGLKVALSLALVGAIVGEFVSSQRGLGFVIMSAQGVFDTVRVFSALIILAVMGLALYFLLDAVEKRATRFRVD